MPIQAHANTGTQAEQTKACRHVPASRDETTGPSIAMPEKRDDRRDNQPKPDDGSCASSITATTALDKPLAKLTRLGSAIKLRKVLSLASLASLALAFAFISWLWWIPHEDPRWRRWVLVPNRLQLSVNVASLVIRTAIGTLAASATTMIASVAVERYGVRLHAVAQVSIARFASNGSTFLAALALRDWVSDYFLRIILLLLALTTIASQFTSTLLVADFERSHIVSFPKPASGAYCPSPGGSLDFRVLQNNLPSKYWREKPQLSETFAEYTETGLTADGVDDTGVAIRAFLPFMSPETRETLQTFKGTATVLNSRITCVRPKISNLTLFYNTSGVWGTTFKILGTAEIDDLAVKAALGVDPETREVGQFECQIRDIRYRQICGLRRGSWANVQDPLANYSQPANIFWEADSLANWIRWWGDFHFEKNFRNSSVMRNSNFTLHNFKLDINNSTKSGPWTQLVLDANGFSNSLKRIEQNYTIRRMGKTLESEGFQPSEIQKIKSEFLMGRFDDAERLMRQRIFEEYIIRQTGEPLRELDSLSNWIKSGAGSVISLRMTICTEFDFGAVGASTGLNHVEIFASSMKPRAEPTYGLATDWKVYDTSVVRRQLGAIASPTTIEDRQIMSISPNILKSSLDKLYELRSNNTTSMDEHESDRLLTSWFVKASSDLDEIRANPKGNSFAPEIIHQVYSDLLDATINETDSPARALQAVYFSRYRKIYNDLINLIPPRDDCNLTVTTFELATVPGRSRGYWAAVGISGTFLICFAVVYVLFDSTQCSLPDNAWHTIAQISESAEISAILSRSKTKTDKEVVEISQHLSQHLKDDDEEDRFVVRGGVFARASMWSAAAKDDSAGDLAKKKTTGLRRRLMAQLRAPRDGA